MPAERYAAERTTHLGKWEDEIPGECDKLFDAYDAWRTAGAIIDDWRVRDAEIRRSAHLSDEAKWTTKQQALADYESRLSRLSEAVARQADEVVGEETLLMRSVEGESGDAVTEIRAGEIRSWYSRLNQEQQGRALGEALDSDDREVVQALLSAPRVFKLLPELLRRHLVDTLVKRRAPELERKRRAVRMAKAALGQAQSLINKSARFAQGRGISPRSREPRYP
jgi:hypothetical protein